MQTKEFSRGSIVNWSGRIIEGTGYISEYSLYDDGDVRDCTIVFFAGQYKRADGGLYNWINLHNADVISGRLQLVENPTVDQIMMVDSTIYEEDVHRNRGRFGSLQVLENFTAELNTLCKKYNVVFDGLGSLPAYNATPVDKKPVFKAGISDDGYCYMIAQYRV